jgi:hypothetical protein
VPFIKKKKKKKKRTWSRDRWLLFEITMCRTQTRRWRTFRERDSITPFIWKRRQPEIRRWWSYRGLRSG